MTPHDAEDPSAPPWRVMLGLAGAHVVAGGLVAAVTGPLDLAHGSWLAAYLVLVGGVAQYVMGRVGLWSPSPDSRPGWSALAGWNSGNALVVAGTLAAVPWLVDAGGVALILAIVASGWSVARAGSASRVPAWARAAYLLVLVVLVVSIPIGMALAHARA